jgi:hypothetical protein
MSLIVRQNIEISWEECVQGRQIKLLSIILDLGVLESLKQSGGVLLTAVLVLVPFLVQGKRTIFKALGTQVDLGNLRLHHQGCKLLNTLFLKIISDVPVSQKVRDVFHSREALHSARQRDAVVDC